MKDLSALRTHDGCRRIGRSMVVEGFNITKSHQSPRRERYRSIDRPVDEELSRFIAEHQAALHQRVNTNSAGREQVKRAARQVSIFE